MSTPSERFHDFALNDEGDVVPNEDFNDKIVANESILQGMANLEAARNREAELEQAEREYREALLAKHALEVAGPYETIGDNIQTQLSMINVAAQLAQYRGGEKGGYTTEEFKTRYGAKSSQVEDGAKRNHRKLVNDVLPALQKRDELIEAGFAAYDVDDVITQTRYELMSKFGTGKAKARDTERARLKSK